MSNITQFTINPLLKETTPIGGDLLSLEKSFGASNANTYILNPSTKAGTGNMNQVKLHKCDLPKTKISGAECFFNADDFGQHFVTIKSNREVDKLYSDIKTLLNDHPEIVEEKEWYLLALLLNFFLKGEEFTLITDPEAYRKEYQSQMEDGDDPFSPDAMSSYGEFDVTEVKSPHISRDDSELVFYVRKKIPYRVTCSLPIESAHPKCQYQLLDYL